MIFKNVRRSFKRFKTIINYWLFDTTFFLVIFESNVLLLYKKWVSKLIFKNLLHSLERFNTVVDIDLLTTLAFYMVQTRHFTNQKETPRFLDLLRTFESNVLTLLLKKRVSKLIFKNVLRSLERFKTVVNIDLLTTLAFYVVQTRHFTNQKETSRYLDLLLTKHSKATY